MNYQIRMFYADAANQTAGTKATKDCSEILSSMGFRHFDVPVYSNKGRLQNMLGMLKRFSGLFFILKAGDTVLLQYPLLGINKWLKSIVDLLGMKRCRKVCLIHDLDSLRQVHHAWTLQEEINRLNAFDLVIVHNEQMKALLEQNGLKTKMQSLELFDYLVPDAVLDAIAEKQEAEFSAAGKRNNIIFAGALGKSGFVAALHELKGLHFTLYGPGYAEEAAVDSVHWAGTFDANELPAKLQGDFGLIWDGEAIDSCSGNLGNYLHYNNPHKASLYLLSRLPLIAPKGSAIGKFIEANGLGFTVNSLFELPDLTGALEESDYQAMKANLSGISTKIASGGFLKKQIEDL